MSEIIFEFKIKIPGVVFNPDKLENTPEVKVTSVQLPANPVVKKSNGLAKDQIPKIESDPGIQSKKSKIQKIKKPKKAPTSGSGYSLKHGLYHCEDCEYKISQEKRIQTHVESDCTIPKNLTAAVRKVELRVSTKDDDPIESMIDRTQANHNFRFEDRRYYCDEGDYSTSLKPRIERHQQTGGEYKQDNGE